MPKGIYRRTEEMNRARTGWHHSEETKRKIGMATRDYMKTPEYRAKVRAGLTPGFQVGHKNGMFGKKHSEETRAKMREAAKNRDQSTYRSGIQKLEKNPRWKGGRIVRPDGYIYLKRPDHPFGGVNRYVAEHRLVMEKYIRRYLQPGEIIHHRDGNPSNNDISNLVLVDKNTHPTGYLGGFKEGLRQGFLAGFLCAYMRRNK